MSLTTRSGPKPQASASSPVKRRVALLLADDRLAGVRQHPTGALK